MSADAERALIGSLVIDPAGIGLVWDELTPADFTKPALGAIFGCMVALHERGEQVDYVTVCEEIEWSGALASYGRTRNLRAAIVTSTINYAPTSLHLESYARAVQEDARRRAEALEHKSTSQGWLAQ